MQLFPTKLLGVVADHGEFPIERIAVDMAGEGRWVGSVGHEEVLKLTDLEEVFEDDGEAGSDGEEGEEDSDDDSDGEGGSDDDGEGEQAKEGAAPAATEEAPGDNESAEDGEEGRADSSDEEPEPEPRKRKRKKEKDPLQAGRRKKGRNEVEAEPAFFADL